MTSAEGDAGILGRGPSASSRSRDRAFGAPSASRCAVWGVLNVTPDSFSDGGAYEAVDAAIAHARRLLSEGADVIDVGGESTRPKGRTYGDGYDDVPTEVELARVLPVIEALAQLGATISIDTVKPAVADAALGAGARYVNDTGGGRDEALVDVVASHGAELVLMHNRGRGEVSGNNVVYGDVVEDVIRELEAAAETALRRGVRESALWLDPGLGFAKTASQSTELLAGLPRLVALGRPVLVGASRKSFLAELAPRPDGSRPGPLERVGGTVVTCTAAVAAGARAVRVHDVEIMRQAVLVAEALFHHPGSAFGRFAGGES